MTTTARSVHFDDLRCVLRWQAHLSAALAADADCQVVSASFVVWDREHKDVLGTARYDSNAEWWFELAQEKESPGDEAITLHTARGERGEMSIRRQNP